ncbi:MAG TPA: hypothetical protein VFU33_07460 [Gaiellaceae bacterium]|nr:hypothetical protein [Gaiellaceae bacterium]
MAALTHEAYAARVDATRLRRETHELKLVVRGNLARSREGLGRAQVAASKSRAWLLEPLPSPWSELRWTRSLETLEKTLVPLP